MDPGSQGVQGCPSPGMAESDGNGGCGTGEDHFLVQKANVFIGAENEIAAVTFFAKTSTALTNRSAFASPTEWQDAKAPCYLEFLGVVVAGPRLIQFTYFLGPGVKVHQSQTLKGNPVAPRPTFTATHTMVSTHWDTAPKFNMENLWSYGHDQVLKIIVETPLNWDRT